MQRRRLIAAQAILDNKYNLVGELEKQLHEIADAFQYRRNSRLEQLCEVVSLRRLVSEDPDHDVAAAVLSGSSRHANASPDMTVLEDATLSCKEPKHVIEDPVPGPVKRRCVRGPLTLDSKPLDDEWAKYASDDKCDPPRVVDVNDTE